MRGILLVVMKQNLLLTLLTTGLACLGLSSCGTGPSMSGSSLSAYQSYNRPASLPSNQSKVRVKVSTSHQMVYVMEGSKALLVMPVSVGTASTPTPKGHFRIFRKVQNIAPIATAMPTRATKCADATCAASPQAGVSRAPRCPIGVSSKPTTASTLAG